MTDKLIDLIARKTDSPEERLLIALVLREEITKEAKRMCATETASSSSTTLFRDGM